MRIYKGQLIKVMLIWIFLKFKKEVSIFVMDISQIKKRGIIFSTPKEWNVQYVTACIIQGLKELDVPFSIVKDNLIDMSKAVCCVDLSQYNHIHIHNKNEIINFGGLENTDMKLVAISSSDNNSLLDVNIPLFATHEVRDYYFEGKIRIPMGFGLSNEIIDSSKLYDLNDTREISILSSHKRTGNQSIRDSAEFSIVPHFKKHFFVDNKLSSLEQYYKRLSRYSACLTYCGCFLPKPNTDIKVPGVYKTETVIVRWDCWKIWESFAFECLVINLDFDKYGFILPVMPVEGEHYLGIDLEDPKSSCERIMDMRSKWRDIAKAGKKWAIENYSPKIVAQRFIENLALL